jgi:hypothetical protein
MRLTRVAEEEHDITIPKHKEIRVGTLNNTLKDIAEHLGKTRPNSYSNFGGRVDSSISQK